MTATKKATKFEIAMRIQQVQTMLLKGETRAWILQNCAEHWGLRERQSDNYIRRAKEEFLASNSDKLELNHAKAIRRLELLLRRSFDNKDDKTALIIVKEIATLQGLYKTQIEHSGKVEFISSVPD